MKTKVITAFMVSTAFAFMAFIAPPKGIQSIKAFTDSNFEGAVTYSITMTGQPNPEAGKMSPMKIYLKGGKSKTITDMVIQTMTTITDCNAPDNPIILYDYKNGGKYQIKAGDQPKKEGIAHVIKYTADTKTIAGYICHKAEVTMTDPNGQSFSMDVYYAEDISENSCDKKFKGLKGFPLEYTKVTGKMTVTITAISVNKQAISDDEFSVPQGYKLVTPQEMMQDIQKNGTHSGGN